MLIRDYIMSGQCLDTVGIPHHVRTGSNIMIAAMLNYSSLFNVYNTYAQVQRLANEVDNRSYISCPQTS